MQPNRALSSLDLGRVVGGVLDGAVNQNIATFGGTIVVTPPAMPVPDPLPMVNFSKRPEQRHGSPRPIR